MSWDQSRIPTCDANPQYQRAVYCVGAIEIPTPRWTAYDAVRLGGEMPDEVPMTITDRAYTSLTLAAGDGAIASLSISVWPGVSSRQP